MLFAPSSSSTFMAHSTPKSSSATYIFSTTGSSYSSAAITPRSYKSLPSSVANRALPSPPGPVTLDTPQAALFAGAVAPNSNAVAVVTKSGAVFVAPLLRGTSGRGFSFGASKEVGRVEGVAIKEGKADVKWGIVDSEKSIELEDEKQTQTHRKVVMVAALVTSGKWYKYGEVIIVGFNEHIR